MSKKSKVPRVSGNPFKGTKEPRAAVSTETGRVPRVADTAVDNSRRVRFCFDIVDHDGDWSILDISREDHSQLLKFLANVETMSEGELFKPGQRLCKTYSDMSECPNPDVLKRLTDEYAGLDHMVRLEIDGLKRLYGVRTGHEFHIVWWDPAHQVWPSTLRNT